MGRGPGVDLALADTSVSRLHAEVIRRDRHVYVCDLGLSLNGTHVNGQPVGRGVLREGDIVSFGRARACTGGLEFPDEAGPTTVLSRPGGPALSRRELEVLTALCRPALGHDTFVTPSTASEIAHELVVTEAAIKQHLSRLYAKFKITEGAHRRARLANEVINFSVVRPLPVAADGEVSPAR